MDIQRLLHIFEQEIKIFAGHTATFQIQHFKSKHLAMINKNHETFQYNIGELVYIISPLTSQLKTASRKVAIKYIGPLAICKIVDPHNYLLMMLDRKYCEVYLSMKD